MKLFAIRTLFWLQYRKTNMFIDDGGIVTEKSPFNIIQYTQESVSLAYPTITSVDYTWQNKTGH